jgi:hypothetical protein
MGATVPPKQFNSPGALGAAPGIGVLAGGPNTAGSAAASPLIPKPPQAPAPAPVPAPAATPVNPVRRAGPNPAMFGNYPEWWNKVAFGKQQQMI